MPAHGDPSQRPRPADLPESKGGCGKAAAEDRNGRVDACVARKPGHFRVLGCAAQRLSYLSLRTWLMVRLSALLEICTTNWRLSFEAVNMFISPMFIVPSIFHPLDSRPFL